MTYYETLGVTQDAEDVVIQAAYRALMRRHHPDTNGGSAGDTRAKAVNEAYAVLSDPGRRRAYDEKLKPSGSGARSNDFAGVGGSAQNDQAWSAQQGEEVRARKRDNPTAKVFRATAGVANGVAFGLKLLQWGFCGVIGLAVVVGLFGQHGGSTPAAPDAATAQETHPDAPAAPTQSSEPPKAASAAARPASEDVSAEDTTKPPLTAAEQAIKAEIPDGNNVSVGNGTANFRPQKIIYIGANRNTAVLISNDGCDDCTTQLRVTYMRRNGDKFYLSNNPLIYYFTTPHWSVAQENTTPTLSIDSGSTILGCSDGTKFTYYIEETGLKLQNAEKYHEGCER